MDISIIKFKTVSIGLTRLSELPLALLLIKTCLDFKMVERILEQEAVIRWVIGLDRKSSHLLPAWQDIVLQSMYAVLGPLADFTDMLSSEEHIIASQIKQLFVSCEKGFSEISYR